MNATAYLPRCVTKYDLAQYFDCNYEFLWRDVITDELLEKWGYDYQKHVKPRRTLNPNLSREIYLHFRITDLNKSAAEEIAEELAQLPPESSKAA